MEVEVSLASLFETTFHALQRETNMIKDTETVYELESLSDSIQRKFDACFKILTKATDKDELDFDTLVGLAKVLDRQNTMVMMYLLIQYAKLGEKET